MNGKTKLLTGAGLGAGAVYFLNRQRSGRLRGLARDKVVHAAIKTEEAMGKIARDSRNRLQGFAANLRSLFVERGADDVVLAERVRSQIGRVSSHPASVDVRVENGRVILYGPSLAAEVDRLIKKVSSMKGIKEVENRLEAHQEPGNIPGLQGAPARHGEKAEFLQENWTPAARFAAGLLGGSLIFYGARPGRLWSKIMGLAAGTGLLLRAVTNHPLKRMVGVGTGRRAVDIQKSINIRVPVERVFGFWSKLENFPKFMSHVKEVKEVGVNRSHWVASGPAGVPVRWDAVISRFVPNKVLAWRTAPGSVVQHAGVVRFSPTPDGGAHMDVKMTYNPGAGMLGHGLAKLLGADPKQQMDEDLVRMKTFLETGNPPHDAAEKPSLSLEGW